MVHQATPGTLAPIIRGTVLLLQAPQQRGRRTPPHPMDRAVPTGTVRDTATACHVCLSLFLISSAFRVLTPFKECMASYGSPPSMYTPPSSTTSSGSSSGSSSSSGGSSSSSGSGATHTVIVAPTQGVLRYVPFALNASVGDTIQFMWGANNHTVTKSSELTPCNKTSDSPFSSGEQNLGFMCSSFCLNRSQSYVLTYSKSHSGCQ